MKRILVVLGGGRQKGNTRQLADAFIQGAVDAGHEIELVSLNQVEVKGCMGCNACQYGKPCIQKDGFSELVPKIKAADLIVFASPLLFWTISAKLKAFIERFYCIAEKDENPSLGRYEEYPVKDTALLMTSADQQSEQADYNFDLAQTQYLQNPFRLAFLDAGYSSSEQSSMPRISHKTIRFHCCISK